jgi:uncharacterized membrane protein (UPF0127 family)
MKPLLVMLLLIGCTKPMTPATNETSTTPPPPPAAAAGPRVIFPDGFVVRVEIAADDELRAQGLMYRDQLRPGTGMLFFFAQDGEYPFWMKNTRIPLDMIWIDSSYRIAAMHHDVPPCQIEDCPSYPPNATSRYVLEVAGGVAKEHGLKVGDVLRFEQTGNVVARP